ncbi:hypothetical protein, partial [Mesorhizobium japonicum]|uniref:hypothetical protein n=1 Tax=Mesorhizobium japonicum TaxID=2066070 RepID=UPI003B5BC860
MVAELLRLRLRLVGNLFRGRSGAVSRRVAGVIVAALLIALVFAGVRMLDGSGAQFTARAIVGLGSFASLAALLMPIIAAPRDLLPARAFLATRVPRRLLVPALPALTLVGPAVLVVPVAFAPLAAWPSADAGLVAGCGILLVLQTLLSLRIGSAIGDALRTRPRIGRGVRAASAILLAIAAVPPVAVVLTRAFLLVPDSIPGPTRAGLLVTRPIEASTAIDIAAASPLGALWAAPAFGHLGDDGWGVAAVVIGAATVVALAALWAAVVVRQLRPTRPAPSAVAGLRVPRWFAALPSSPLGAVTARSIVSWMRDPRYLTVLATVPVIPAIMLLATWIGGIPFPAAVLIPLPIMT